MDRWIAIFGGKNATDSLFERKEGIWPVRASATSEKLNILVYLTLKRSSVLS